MSVYPSKSCVHRFAFRPVICYESHDATMRNIVERWIQTLLIIMYDHKYELSTWVDVCVWQNVGSSTLNATIPYVSPWSCCVTEMMTVVITVTRTHVVSIHTTTTLNLHSPMFSFSYIFIIISQWKLVWTTQPLLDSPHLSCQTKSNCFY